MMEASIVGRRGNALGLRRAVNSIYVDVPEQTDSDTNRTEARPFQASNRAT